MTLKSAITRSFIGLIATMLPVCSQTPSPCQLHTDSFYFTSVPVDGDNRRLVHDDAFAARVNQRVGVVPRSIARSLENTLNSERMLLKREELL